MPNHNDLVIIHWVDVIQFSDWTPSSDPITNCPEFHTVGYLMSDDSTDDTIKLATTLDASGVGTGVISFPVGVVKEVTTVERKTNTRSTRRNKRK